MPDIIKELTQDSFDKFIQSEHRAIVKFSAEWCGPCQMLKPVVEEVAKEQKDKVKFGDIDIDNNSELAQRFQVMSVPTMIFFKDKEQVHRIQGAVDKEKLLKDIKENL